MRGKHIIVAVSAGIAAYKAIEVVSRLRKKGAEVKVVMTQNSTHIASPLTFGEISGHPVAIDMFEQVHQWDVEHIALATWADAYVVIPATANVIGKIYAGIADDMLTTTIMATKAPKYLCPAMNTEMYNNPITQRNLEGLRSLGYHIMEPAEGWLACGVTGVGRLPEPEAIVDWLESQMCKSNELEGITVLVTAGGTQENIDPVRYISNHSSGKMGFAIAEAFAKRGANVTLIAGPVNLATPKNVHRIDVTTAHEMWRISLESAVKNRIFIGCAAVADYRVAEVADQKIKKTNDNDELSLKLVKNPDIIASVANLEKDRPFVVGFAAETQNVAEYAKSKLQRKNLDMICANDVSGGQVFGQDQNALQIFWKTGEKALPLADKNKLAEVLVSEIVEHYHK